MKSFKLAKLGVLFGLLSLGLRSILPPTFIEAYYSRGVFLAIRTLIDTLIGTWLPIASLYLLILWGIVKLWQSWRNRKSNKARNWQAWLWRPLGFVGYALALFLWLWGYNYGRVGVEQQMNLPEAQLSLAEVQANVRAESIVLTRLREQIAEADTLALANTIFPEDMEAQLRIGLEKILTQYGYPTVGRVRGRLLYPKGIFLRFGSAGLYFPWTGEGHIDAGLLALQQPYTMAHELAHGYGFGDEGACSFWAYLTAFAVEDPVLEYALRLGYWRSLAGVWVRTDPESYAPFRAGLARGITADLDAINANILAYPDIMPRFRDAAYDVYLKAQGIQEGMLNYGRVVALVEAWRKQNSVQD